MHPVPFLVYCETVCLGERTNFPIVPVVFFLRCSATIGTGWIVMDEETQAVSLLRTKLCSALSKKLKVIRCSDSIFGILLIRVMMTCSGGF